MYLIIIIFQKYFYLWKKCHFYMKTYVYHKNLSSLSVRPIPSTFRELIRKCKCRNASQNGRKTDFVTRQHIFSTKIFPFFSFFCFITTHLPNLTSQNKTPLKITKRKPLEKTVMISSINTTTPPPFIFSVTTSLFLPQTTLSG